MVLVNSLIKRKKEMMFIIAFGWLFLLWNIFIIIGYCSAPSSWYISNPDISYCRFHLKKFYEYWTCGMIGLFCAISALGIFTFILYCLFMFLNCIIPFSSVS
jgi:uncharacterized membrane protein